MKKFEVKYSRTLILACLTVIAISATIILKTSVFVVNKAPQMSEINLENIDGKDLSVSYMNCNPRCADDEICFFVSLDNGYHDWRCIDDPRCDDGTSPGACSTTHKGSICNNGELELDCETCGCPYGQVCDEGACIKASGPLCKDGTPYGKCSITKPNYCDNGTLVQDCDTCNCPGTLTCNSSAPIQCVAGEDPTYYGGGSQHNCVDGTLKGDCSLKYPTKQCYISLYKQDYISRLTDSEKCCCTATGGVWNDSEKNCTGTEGVWNSDYNACGTAGATQCSDGTKVGNCSAYNEPKYCDFSGVLVDDCTFCGCPTYSEFDPRSRPVCHTTTGQCIEKTSCSDGTPYGECSLVHRGQKCRIMDELVGNSGYIYELWDDCECGSCPEIGESGNDDRHFDCVGNTMGGQSWVSCESWPGEGPDSCQPETVDTDCAGYQTDDSQNGYPGDEYDGNGNSNPNTSSTSWLDNVASFFSNIFNMGGNNNNPMPTFPPFGTPKPTVKPTAQATVKPTTQATVTPSPNNTVLIKGDINGDNKVDISDAVLEIDFIFGNATLGDGRIHANAKPDVDASGASNISDVLEIIKIIFNS